MRVAKGTSRYRWNPGAVIRQRLGFGDVSGFDKISGEYFTLAAGVDTTPCLRASKATCVRVPTGAMS